MRQALGEYDDRDDGFGLVGEQRAEEPPPRDRRLPMVLLTVFAMALFAGGLWFAYVQGTRHPATTARGDGVPLIRADEHPSKVKPDQPGGMTIPDQNVSLYSEKSGGPSVEKLLPEPERPMPRPAAAPPELSPSPAPGASTPAPSPSPPAAAPAATHVPASPPAKAAAKAAPSPAAKAAAQPKQAAPGKAGPVQLRLGSLHSPEAAREEWAKLKRDNPDLLGKLTAVAVRADLGDKGIFYRIQAGSFADAAAAERLCGELKRRNLGCILAR